MAPLIINEVFPNPLTGSEWVEIIYLSEDQDNPPDYLNFTISDDKKVLYTFQGDEVWSDNFLVIELSGLNNDQDSVTLQDDESNIIDQMSYTSTEKGLSWSRTNSDQAVFELAEATANYPNINFTVPVSPNPSPTVTNSVSPTINPQPSANPTASIDNSTEMEKNNTPSPTINKNFTQEKTNNQINEIKLLSNQDLANEYFSNYQNLQLSYNKDQQFPQSRLVFLGQKILKKPIVDAIIGSSLLLIAAVLLSYDQRSKHEN